MSSAVPTRNLRDQVEELLPGWQSWYPSLFEAACDLGILRARVCDLSTLVLSRRHASIYNEAVQAFREQWSAEEPEEPPREASGNAFQLNQADAPPDSDNAD